MKRIIALLSFIGVLIMVGATNAMAATVPYPAPPVTTPTTVIVTTTISSVTSSSDGPSASDLAYTGSGMNLGMTIAVGVGILVIGLALILFGAFRTRRRGTH